MPELSEKTETHQLLFSSFVTFIIVDFKRLFIVLVLNLAPPVALRAWRDPVKAGYTPYERQGERAPRGRTRRIFSL